MNTLYSVTVPVFAKSLTALDGILAKAQAFANETNTDEATLLEAHLAADMFSFKKQVQIACDNAKGSSARLAKMEPPVHADEETTIAQLRERITKTLAFLATIPESAFEGAAEQQIVLPYFPGKYLTGAEFALEYAIPNFFFHLVTAYDILRKEGVQLGKGDYLGGLPLKDQA